MKLRKTIAAVAAVGLAVTGLAACGKGTSVGAGDANGPVTVNWWTWDEHQAAAYKKCIPDFESANPDIKVEITQYNVDDYFTKLTTGFVAGTAPDAFMDSPSYLGDYASQNQIMPLDDLIKSTDYDLSQHKVGIDSWKYTDGKQYGIPMDWAGAAIYFNTAKITEAGLTEDDITNMTWNPTDGGTFDHIISHLTVDKNGVRGDEAGFDKSNIATYGINSLAAKDWNGQTSWNPFVSSLGWRFGPDWTTSIPFDDPEFAKTLDYLRNLIDRGLMPGYKQFTVSNSEQLGSGSVAMVLGGTWDATSITKVPGVTVKVAPVIEGPKGRSMISNSNGHNIFAGTKHKDQTWKWVSYMASPTCQATAGKDGATFLPSIPSALQDTVDAMKTQGLDISSFMDAMNDGELYPNILVNHGSELTDTIQPMFEQFWTFETDDTIFPKIADTAKSILGS